MKDHEVSNMYAGRLKYFLKAWERITDNQNILNAIVGYKIPFISEPQQSQWPAQIQFNEEENNYIKDKIAELLANGVIRTTDATEVKFMSNIFLVPKSENDFRLILNLKKLNSFVHNEHFKMDDYRSACTLVSENCFMAILDLKDAYHLIPVDPSDQFFLCFMWNNIIYRYTCIPFGLSTAPRLFTKLFKPVLGKLRSKGYSSVGYIDDFLLLGNSEMDCLNNLKRTKALFTKLGWLINEKKTVLPCQQVTYLGFVFNSIQMTIALKPKKQAMIITLANHVLKCNSDKQLTCLLLAKFIGNLVAATPTVPYGELYVRQLELEKTKALEINGGEFSGQLILSAEAISDIYWWQVKVQQSFKSIRCIQYDLVLTTDASLTGWGAHDSVNTLHGHWNTVEKRLHINTLELMAIEKALNSLGKKGRNILIRTDSTTAIAYINNFGGCRSAINHKVAKRIWQQCEKLSQHIYASYISTHCNFVADSLSRIQLDETDFSLNSTEFDTICRRLGRPEIDLFATAVTKKCKLFVSWYPQPGCLAVDAFTIRWTSFYYAFPPFALVSKVLKKAKFQQASGIIVVPFWPTQSWFPMFLEMSVQTLILGPHENLIFCPYKNRPHVLNRNLQLMAGLISKNRIVK